MEKTIEEFFDKLVELYHVHKVNSDAGYSVCKSCSSKYPADLKKITEGYCPGCAAELFYDNVSLAVTSITQEDRKKVNSSIRANSCKTLGQRCGERHILGG